MWFDDQFENTFRRLSNRFFNSSGIFENPVASQVQTYGPYYYGYEMTLGSDGKPRVREWGNVRPTNALTDMGTREPYVDETVDEKNGILKLVTEMPGIEKSDIQVNVADSTVSISAKHGDRKYGANVPLKYKVNENSVKAKYLNGILELTFKLAEEKPKGKLVSVE
ncbi:MAG TPA: archaeal heat shock protein Hsp20 [Nitrosarchaeum sp.]|jgi:HSP20 family protein|nr:archaeal heat shock protein Hsp20 [Nitrosarchaeum sp.]